MKVKDFLKAPEKAMSEWGGIEWKVTRREVVVGALAAVACVSALALQASEGGPKETADIVPSHETVEVSD